MIRHESTGSIVEPAGRNPGLRWARLVTGLLVGSLPGLCAASADHQPPSAPGSLVAHAIGITELTLEWSAASDNVRVTAYEVSQDGCVAGTTSGLSRHVTALDPGSSHQFAVRARDAAGNWSVPTAPITVTTLTDVTPPTIPGGLDAGDVTLQGFQLTWAASADDVKVTGYEIFRNGESVATTAGRSHRVGGLAPGTNSRMAVRARDAAGNWSGRSEELAVSTLADTTPPSRPAELCAAGVRPTRLTLRWEPAKDNVRVTAYEVFRDGVSLGVSSSTARMITGLAPATLYHLTVRAGDAAGNWSPASAALAVTTAADAKRPTAPAVLTAVPLGSTGFTLQWRPSTDNVGVTGYEVLRDGVVIGTTTNTSLVVTGLAPSAAYRFTVRARDAAGNWSSASAAVKVKTTAADLVPPAAPTQLVAGAISATGFTLSWSAAHDDVGVAGYEVFRDGVSLGRTTQTSMAVTGLAADGSYHLSVRAVDAAGNWSEASTELVVTLGPGPLLAGFEPDEGYLAGPLAGQDGWRVTGDAAVVTAPVHGGSQAVSLPAASVASVAVRPFLYPAGDIAFIDLFAQPVAAPLADGGVFFETEAAAVALTGHAGAGQIEVRDGDGQGGGVWRPLPPTLALESSGRAADWLRLTLRADRRAKHWDLYLNGRMIAANLGFVSDTIAPEGVLSLGGSTLAAAAFDEVLMGTENPVFADADRDGMDDAWEAAHGLNPAADDRDADRDGDGVSNINEYVLGADPALADSDHDGLTDAEERLLGTDPSHADSDGDGMPDGWELRYGLDPLRADGGEDWDGDGQTNAQEFAAGTNPADFFNGRAVTIGSTAPVIGASTNIEYLYDASGRLTTASYPSGIAVHYVRDDAGNLTSVNVTGVSPIVAWRTASGLPSDGSGLGADDAIVANDRLPNLVKYALGLDPRVPVTADVPEVSLLTVGGNRYLALTYRRPEPAPADVSYTVDVSADGVTWSSDNGATQVVSSESSPGYVRITVRDTTPEPARAPGRRIRLRIDRGTSS